MMFKNKVIFLFSLCCFSLGLACAEVEPVSGSVAMPMPPTENPHSPTTPEDKARVAFAELAVQKLLFSATGKEVSPLTDYDIDRSQLHMDFDQACLMDAACLQKNAEATQFLDAIKSVYGPVTEMKHAHVIPWSFQKFKQQLLDYSSDPGMTTGDSTHAAREAKSDMPPPMPAPVLDSYEYMIHMYVTFGKRGSTWYHMDVIVTEGGQGNLKLRRFYIVPMAIPGNDLPEGAVC